MGHADYRGQQFSPHHHHHHTWNNHPSQSAPPQQASLSPSPSPDHGGTDGRKARGRKVKKSDSESGISKLLKTLRKDSSGKKAAAAAAAGGGGGKLRGGRELSSSSILDGRFRRQRRGSLDRSPGRQRGSSPDRRRAKSVDRRAERAQRERTPERGRGGGGDDDGGFLAATPERGALSERRLRKDSWTTPERVGAASADAFANNYNNRGDAHPPGDAHFRAPSSSSSSLSSLPRGRALRGAAKNGNLLRDSSPDCRDQRYRTNGTPERRYRAERDSSPDSSSGRGEVNCAAASRLKDYYSMMKNNNAAAASGHGTNQLPEPKRRLYKESPKDLSI